MVKSMTCCHAEWDTGDNCDDDDTAGVSVTLYQKPGYSTDCARALGKEFFVEGETPAPGRPLLQTWQQLCGAMA